MTPSRRPACGSIARTARHACRCVFGSPLAYGVNMPFRTCCFCGHTVPLNPLTAQMSGRADAAADQGISCSLDCLGIAGGDAWHASRDQQSSPTVPDHVAHWPVAHLLRNPMVMFTTLNECRKTFPAYGSRCEKGRMAGERRCREDAGAAVAAVDDAAEIAACLEAGGRRKGCLWCQNDGCALGLIRADLNRRRHSAPA